MKKLLIASCLLIYLSGFSQKNKPERAQNSPLQFGLKAGGNYSGTIFSATNQYYDVNYKFGYYGGLIFKIDLPKSMSLQPEILYNEKGDRLKELQDEDVTAIFNFVFLSMPIMFQYQINPKFYVEVGPEISYLLSVKLKFKKNTYDDEDLTELYSPLDAGLGFGIGYSLSPKISVGARYTYGFIPGANEEAYFERSGVKPYKFTHSNAQLGINYFF